MNEWAVTITEEDANKVIDSTCIKDPCPTNTEFVSLHTLKAEEYELASALAKVVHTKSHSAENVEMLIDSSLDPEQIMAVRACLKSSLVVTGKAGTGKTKVIKEMVRILTLANFRLRLCAPTGKAAVRMSEGVGIKATTLHFAIASTMSEEPCEEVVIIDEASMLAPPLLIKLLRSLKVIRLILVGDHNQLPSIDPGSLMRDVILSNQFPVCTLQTIHRQGNGSILSTKAADILSGKAKDWQSHSCDAFSLQFSSNPLENAIESTKSLHLNEEAVQMLVLTRKSATLANIELQKRFNPSTGETVLERSQKAPWKINDKIIATENYYESGELLICNGSLGTLTSIDYTSKKVQGQFDGVARTFTCGTNEIDHSYALTLHKYQGSEIDCVVVCLDYVPSMASREALYTAATRAKKRVVIHCNSQIWSIACARNENDRETRLSYFMQRCAKKRSME